MDDEFPARLAPIKELTEAPASMLRFSGTPVEVGGQIWMRMCNPAICAVSTQPELERIQLYAGILMAGLGSMAADFGHAQAASVARTLLDSFDLMADDLGGCKAH